MLTPELPLDLSTDRTILVRPDSCRRPPHTIAGFELPFLVAHSRQRNQGCSHETVAAEIAIQLLTLCQKLYETDCCRTFLYTNYTTWVYVYISWCGCLRAPLFDTNCVLGGQPTAPCLRSARVCVFFFGSRHRSAEILLEAYVRVETCHVFFNTTLLLKPSSCMHFVSFA